MTERVFIGNDAGLFKMRVSRPGYPARSASADQCVIHEAKQRPLMFVQQGYAVIAAGGAANINLGRSFAFPPVVILKHESNRIDAASARLSLGSGVLNISVKSGMPGSLVKYVVMAPQ